MDMHESIKRALNSLIGRILQNIVAGSFLGLSIYYMFTTNTRFFRIFVLTYIFLLIFVLLRQLRHTVLDSVPLRYTRMGWINAIGTFGLFIFNIYFALYIFKYGVFTPIFDDLCVDCGIFYQLMAYILVIFWAILTRELHDDRARELLSRGESMSFWQGTKIIMLTELYFIAVILMLKIAYIAIYFSVVSVYQ